MNEEINNQKVKARDTLSASKKLLSDSAMEDNSAIRNKMDELKQWVDTVSGSANERQSLLEQAVPFARHFHEAHTELVVWLDDVEPVLSELDVLSVDADQVKKQQEKAKVGE